MRGFFRTLGPLFQEKPENKSLYLRVLLLAAILALVFYALLFKANLCSFVGGADSSGYLNTAWRLRHGNVVEPIRGLQLFSLDDELSHLFRPLGFTWGLQRNTQVPFYPLGMPLQMMASAEIFGWKAGPFLVSPAAAILGVILIYFLGRQFGLSRFYSAAGASILALSPIYLFIGLQPMSDVLATAWGMAAVLAGLLSRKRAGWAAVSGAAFGLGFLVRPTDALLIFPLLLALPARKKAYLLFAAAGLPFGLFWLITNKLLYGGWLVSGYRGMVGKDLVLGVFPFHFTHYVSWISALLTPLALLLWLAVAAVRKAPVRDRILLIVWFLPLFLFYCFYRPDGAWWYLRFLLPGFPALILAGLLTARNVLNDWRERFGRLSSAGRRVTAVALVCLAVVLANELRMIARLGVFGIDEAEIVYRQSCDWANERWPEKSVVLATQTSGALAYYTHFIPCRWNLLRPGQFELIRRRAEEKGFGFYAMLFPFEEEGFRKQIPGRWIKVQNVRQVSLWRMMPGE